MADVVLIAGGTASGKTSLLEELRASYPNFHEVTIKTTTTRGPRQDETAFAYNFRTDLEFKELIEKGRLVEFDMVKDTFYGVEKNELLKAVENARANNAKVLGIMTPSGIFRCKDFLEEQGVSVSTIFVEAEKNISIVRTVSRYMAERRSLKESDASPEQHQQLADHYADRISHIRNIETQWRHYNWDYRIYNGEGKDRGTSTEELHSVITMPSEAEPELRLAIQQAASSPVR